MLSGLWSLKGWGISQFMQPHWRWEGLSNFSEGLYRRNLGLLGGNWHFRWGKFFSGETWKLPFYIGFEIQMLCLSTIKCWGNLGTFQFASTKRQQKKLPMIHQKLLYIMSATTSTYLNIWSVPIIWFSNSWDYLFYLNYIWLITYTWMGEMEDNISFIDHLALVSFCVLAIAG